MSIDRLTAALADRYAIGRELGAGGMATVYLAEDLKHKRQVAVKVLRPELAAVLGAERFVQEIETTAGLQHPNILPLFDSGRAETGQDGQGRQEFLYYVMPYIDGETLRDKLNRETQLGIEDAVKIASDVADALDYAHRQDVIHRDIKPENILLHDGRPMVADFGIALAVSAAAGNRMTETGLSLGTPHYMSPEQATAEKELTNRSDIYSLGAVLYEMLTGDPPHTGSSAQQIIMRIVTDEAAPVTTGRKSVPVHVAGAVMRSIEKLPADRFGTAADFARALQNVEFRHSAPVHPHAVGPTNPIRLWQGVSAVLTAVLLLSFLWPETSDSTAALHFGIAVPGGHTMRGGEGSQLSISPDGAVVAYVADSGLFLRHLDTFEPLLVDGTRGATSPFFSPDSRWVGFALGGMLHKAPVDGGAMVEIPGTNGAENTAAWGVNDSIVFAAGIGQSGLWIVPEEGGERTQITEVDLTLELGHAFPQLIDDDRMILFTAPGPTGLWSDVEIVLLDRESGERETVLRGGSFGRYVDGYLFHADAHGTVFASTFDLATRAVGPATPVQSGVRVAIWAGGAASIAIADNGTAAFVRGTSSRNHLLHWVNRRGEDLGRFAVPLTTDIFRFSPDGRQLALWVQDTENGDVWAFDVRSEVRQRVTDDPMWNWYPVWSPDGQKMAYTRSGSAQILVRDLNTGAETVVLTQGYGEVWPTSWSPDGRWILFFEQGDRTHQDVHALLADSVDHRIPIAVTDAREFDPWFSRDGRFVAYQADDDTWVRSFPDLGPPIRITEGGGRTARFSSDGDELFLWKGDSLMVTDISTDNGFQRGPLQFLFRLSNLSNVSERQYDLYPNSDSILVALRNPDAAAPEIEVVTGWLARVRTESR